MATKEKFFGVFINMQTTIPFRRRRNGPDIGRNLIIERGVVVELGKSPETFTGPFDVNFIINWNKGDGRDEGILSGVERQQNVMVDARRVLLALQGMYPELDITFKAKEDSNVSSPTP